MRRDAYDPLFINHQVQDMGSDADASRLSARSIQKMVARCALLAGISKKVSPHTLRHT
jgi:site-specific recombinase XerD